MRLHHTCLAAALPATIAACSPETAQPRDHAAGCAPQHGRHGHGGQGHGGHGGQGDGGHGGHGHGGHGHGGQGGHGHGGHGAGHFADPSKFVSRWNDPARDAWQKPAEILAAMGLRAGDTALDLGAGTGYLVPPLRSVVGDAGQVIALDVEPAMVRYLNGEVAKAGWRNVRVHLGGDGDPVLPAEIAHGAVALNVWHHLGDRVAYARRLLSVVRPGGALVVVEFLKEPTEGFGPPLEMRLHAEQVLADLRAAGWEAEVVAETLPRQYIVRGRRPK